ARPIYRLARRRTAIRSRWADRTPDRRNLDAMQPCATPSQIDFWRSARQSGPQNITVQARKVRAPRGTAVMPKFLFLIATTALLAAAPAANAQQSAADYPNKPVRVIVTVPAGGGVDTVTRIVTEKMRTKLGQPFVIENK